MSDIDETQEAPTQGTPDSLAAQLIAALGLPAHTYMLEILFVADAPVSVRCHYYPDEDAMRKAVALFGEYELVAKRAPQEEGAPAEEETGGSVSK